MKSHSPARLACCLLALLFLLGGLSVPARADGPGIDLDRDGSLCLSLFYEKKPVSGGDLRLYRVGEVEQDDGNYYFRLLACFGGERLDQKGLDSPGLTERLAGDKEALASLEYRSTVFGADGKASFSPVKPGLYLLTQSKPAEGFQLISPILVSVPYHVSDEEGYVYDVDASVKPAVEREATPSPSPSPAPPPTPGNKLPQTGQLNWPVPVMAGLGLCFVLLGVLLLASDGRRARR